MSAQDCHTWRRKEQFRKLLRIHHCHDPRPVQPLVTAAAEPYGFRKDLTEMTVEVHGDLFDFLVFLFRERPRKINHHRTVAIFQYIFRNPAEDISHKIMESQRELRQHNDQSGRKKHPRISEQILYKQFDYPYFSAETAE